jgi:leucyl/phenylalanyl-tRNA--protein transferase
MFTDPEWDWSDENGLVAVGGELRPERVLAAYRQGVFPWYGEGSPVLWWSPDPRAIFELDGLRISRRLARVYRSGRFTFTFNRCFRDVMRACAEQRDDGTWITAAMLQTYAKLHELGHAHSIETWRDGRLVGGLYGVAIGGFFAGESMFYRVADASKVAMIRLFEQLRERGYVLFDTQFLTPHTQRLGACEVPRAEYLRRLQAALKRPVCFADDCPPKSP